MNLKIKKKKLKINPHLQNNLSPKLGELKRILNPTLKKLGKNWLILTKVNKKKKALVTNLKKFQVKMTFKWKNLEI